MLFSIKVTSSPSYNEVFNNVHVWPHLHRGAAHYVGISTLNQTHKATMLINHNTDTITQYFYEDSATYDFTKNVTGLAWPDSVFEQYGKVGGTLVDADNQRLYIMFYNNVGTPRRIIIGYFDISTVNYAFNEVINVTGLFTSEQMLSNIHSLLIPELNAILLCTSSIVTSWKGTLKILSLDSGAVLYEYDVDTNAGFPYQGINFPVYYDNHVYGTFEYHSADGQADYRGLVDINLDTSVIRYHRPSFATIDDYNFREKVSMGDGRLLMGIQEYGVTIFDTDSQAWTLFNNDNVPGLEPGL